MSDHIRRWAVGTVVDHGIGMHPGAIVESGKSERNQKIGSEVGKCA